MPTSARGSPRAAEGSPNRQVTGHLSLDDASEFALDLFEWHKLRQKRRAEIPHRYVVIDSMLTPRRMRRQNVADLVGGASFGDHGAKRAVTVIGPDRENSFGHLRVPLAHQPVAFHPGIVDECRDARPDVFFNQFLLDAKHA